MILSPQNHLVLSISIWYDLFLHELSVIQMKQGKMNCLEGGPSRRNTTKTWMLQTSKEWDGIPLSPDLKRFRDKKWKNINNSGHTGLTFKWGFKEKWQCFNKTFSILNKAIWCLFDNHLGARERGPDKKRSRNTVPASTDWMWHT